MKKELTLQNLSATHYDNGNHILEFDADEKKVFVTVRSLGPVDDENYWDDAAKVARAVAEAADDDIEIA